MLPDAEANSLKNDARVLDVAIPFQDSNLELDITQVRMLSYKGTSSGQYYDWET